jgi:hypothetical protein
MSSRKNVKKKNKKKSDEADGRGFGLLLLFGLVIKLIWWILAVLVLVLAFFVVRAILRENRRRKARYAQYVAAMSARADEQNNWAIQGDDRGVYGTYGARLMSAVRSGRAR